MNSASLWHLTCKILWNSLFFLTTTDRLWVPPVKKIKTKQTYIQCEERAFSFDETRTKCIELVLFDQNFSLHHKWDCLPFDWRKVIWNIKPCPYQKKNTIEVFFSNYILCQVSLLGIFYPFNVQSYIKMYNLHQPPSRILRTVSCLKKMRISKKIACEITQRCWVQKYKEKRGSPYSFFF